ncbi:MAG: hypothetical protein IPM10_12495 [Chitinophagaceae bacterium]|nr:hypothetical protein [Chitinophagaceae bacterium]
MKKIILAALVLISVNSFAQKYDDKIKIAKDKAFQEMVLNAAYASAKSIVADNTATSVEVCNYPPQLAGGAWLYLFNPSGSNK